MADPAASNGRRPRTLFGPTLALGVLGAGGLAVAGNRDWVRIEADLRAQAQTGILWDSIPGLGQMPLAGALGLVALACWGVLLVGRGAVRRVLAAVAALAGAGAFVVWVFGLVQLRSEVAERVEQAVLPGDWSVVWTAWFPAAGLAALVAVAAGVLAWVKAPTWPTMSSRYDAPGGGSRTAATDDSMTAADLSEVGETDLWRAIDEGRDPT